MARQGFRGRVRSGSASYGDVGRDKAWQGFHGSVWLDKVVWGKAWLGLVGLGMDFKVGHGSTRYGSVEHGMFGFVLARNAVARFMRLGSVGCGMVRYGTARYGKVFGESKKIKNGGNEKWKKCR